MFSAPEKRASTLHAVNSIVENNKSDTERMYNEVLHTRSAAQINVSWSDFIMPATEMILSLYDNIISPIPAYESRLPNKS